MRMPISPRNGARGSKDVQYLKYNMLEWESRLILGLNAVKNVDYIEKWFKRKLRKIKFPTKTRWKHISF